MAYSWTETIGEGAEIDTADVAEVRTAIDACNDGCYANYTGDDATHDSGHDSDHYSNDDSTDNVSHDSTHWTGDDSSHDSGHDSTDYATHNSNHDAARYATHYGTNLATRYTYYYSGHDSSLNVGYQGSNTGGEA